jgi:hypothetical protein
MEAEAKKQPFSPSPLFFTKKKRGPKEKIMARLEEGVKK